MQCLLSRREIEPLTLVLRFGDIGRGQHKHHRVNSPEFILLG